MSVRTTNFGPRVSFTTNLADPGPVLVEGDSNSSFSWGGPLTLDGAMAVGGAITSTGVNAWSGVNTFSDELVSTATLDQTALTSTRCCC